VLPGETIHDESRDRFRRTYAADRDAYDRESLSRNHSYPATLITVLVPAMLIGLLCVWLRDYKMLAFVKRAGNCIVASASLRISRYGCRIEW
jgi:hypothetical protein